MHRRDDGDLLVGLFADVEAAAVSGAGTEHLARGGPLYVAALAHALAGAGRRADAERELQRLVELSARQYVSPVQLAIVHAGLGHAQEAIEWLEKGIDGRSADMVWIKDDPRFDPLRPDSRFQDIVTRLRFP